MNRDRFDGTAARQLDLIHDAEPLVPRARTTRRPEASMRVLRRDVYAELAKRQKGHVVYSRPGEFQLVYNMFVGEGP